MATRDTMRLDEKKTGKYFHKKKAKNWEFINLESSHTGNVEVYEAKVGILSDFFHQVF